jgi:acyl carrier protein
MAGARYLILTGRSGIRNSEDQHVVDHLEQSGAKVLVVKADISIQEDAARLFAKIESQMPPLKGIVHAAGLLDDGTLFQQTWERFENVMAPKVKGLWNLHRQTQELALDFFIAFSSIASLLGSPGQGNYAAANAFMDGFMQDRHRRGLPGLSINWGPWAQVGMAARLDDRYQERQSALGLNPLLPVLGLQALEASLEIDSAQVAVMIVDWGQFFQQFPLASEVPLLEAFNPRRSAGSGIHAELLAKLKSAPTGERKSMLLEHLQTELARILGLRSPQQIDLQHRLLDFGLDSLMAVELIISLEMSLGTTLPATMIMNYPTIGAVIDYMIDEVLELGDTPDPDSTKKLDDNKLDPNSESSEDKELAPMSAD